MCGTNVEDYAYLGCGDAGQMPDVADATSRHLGHDPSEVHPVSAEEYGDEPAQRPLESMLDLSKIEATEAAPAEDDDYRRRLRQFTRELKKQPGQWYIIQCYSGYENKMESSTSSVCARMSRLVFTLFS